LSLELDADLTTRFQLALSARPVFVVGSPRSGTTMLRLLLDAHDELAIPGESHFVPGLRPRWYNRNRSRERTIEAIASNFYVKKWDVDDDALLALVRSDDAADYAGIARAFFAGYAALKGKTRWGDKTPGYVSYLTSISALFPDVQVVHLIRDGRQVARSIAEQEWGAPTLVSAARWWRNKVARGCGFGRSARPDQYLEVRLEHLTADPERTARRLCDFLGVPFDPDMLRFHETAAERMRGGGRGLHRHLVSPVTPDLREWSEGLSMRDRHLVEAACAPLLVELGYADEQPPLRWRLAADATRARDMATRLPKAARARLRPSTRSV
jgi:hypothetical protein